MTQAFNTTTSMGRLTLNMLLSFAQFEREITGERIRDKVRLAFGSKESVCACAWPSAKAVASRANPSPRRRSRSSLNDNFAGKPEGIQLEIGQHPFAAFGNSTGDQQMLEYTKGGDGLRLSMIVLHDDAKREYAYGPAQGLPDTKVGSPRRSTTKPRRPAGSSSA